MSKAKTVESILSVIASLGKKSKFKPAQADDFLKSVLEAMPVPKGDINIGDMLTQYGPEEYALMKMFLSPDKQAGYALKGGDELVSVFSVPGGRGRSIAEDAALRGARRLDNYDVRGKLPELYGSVGFEETGRYPFNPEFAGDLSAGARALEPDYVEMAMNSRVADELKRLRGAGPEDLRRILSGGTGRVTRKRGAQNSALAALAALASGGVLKENE